MADLLEFSGRECEGWRDKDDPKRAVIKPIKKEHELQVDPIKLANNKQDHRANFSKVKIMP
jgi:hypothetical protein